jgi:hypothetical protein
LGGDQVRDATRHRQGAGVVPLARRTVVVQSEYVEDSLGLLRENGDDAEVPAAAR